MSRTLADAPLAALPQPDPVAMSAAERERRLDAWLAGRGSLIVAFSGGVDSSYLAVRAAIVLGPAALAVTAESASYPSTHRLMAARVVAAWGLRHRVIATRELDNPAYRANAPDRCYHCKRELYARLSEIARREGFAAIADGTNVDDRDEDRPGRRAAREFGVESPLEALGFTKENIRERSRSLGLLTWDMPASPCLASRIPHHHEVTPDKLRQVEQAEAAVRALGFRVCRVRHHGDLARLEFGQDELPRAIEPAVADALTAGVRAAGFRDVVIDPRGYRPAAFASPIWLRPS